MKPLDSPQNSPIIRFTISCTGYQSEDFSSLEDLGSFTFPLHPEDNIKSQRSTDNKISNSAKTKFAEPIANQGSKKEDETTSAIENPKVAPLERATPSTTINTANQPLPTNYTNPPNQQFAERYNKIREIQINDPSSYRLFACLCYMGDKPIPNQFFESLVKKTKTSKPKDRKRRLYRNKLIKKEGSSYLLTIDSEIKNWITNLHKSSPLPHCFSACLDAVKTYFALDDTTIEDNEMCMSLEHHVTHLIKNARKYNELVPVKNELPKIKSIPILLPMPVLTKFLGECCFLQPKSFDTLLKSCRYFYSALNYTEKILELLDEKSPPFDIPLKHPESLKSDLSNLKFRLHERFAWVNLSVGNNEEALKYLNHIIEVKQNWEAPSSGGDYLLGIDIWLKAKCLTNISKSQSTRIQIDSASPKDLFAEALKCFESYENSDFLYKCLLDFATFFQTIGSCEDALAQCKNLADKAQKEKQANWHLMSVIKMAKIALHFKKIDNAKNYIVQAKALCKKLPPQNERLQLKIKKLELLIFSNDGDIHGEHKSIIEQIEIAEKIYLPNSLEILALVFKKAELDFKNNNYTEAEAGLTFVTEELKKLNRNVEMECYFKAFKASQEMISRAEDMSKHIIDRRQRLNTFLKKSTHESASLPVLASINESLYDFDKITSLNLSGNSLTELPAEISLLHNLRRLDLTNNEFREVPSVINELKGLKVLIIRGNKIEKIDPKLKNHPSLNKIDILDNPIREVSDELYDLIHDMPYLAEWSKQS